MAIKHYKPTTNGRRGMSTLANDEITTSTPTKSLLSSKSKTGGRNNQGKMTVRHIGGGAKRKYRLIDYKRNKFGVTGRVATIEYDPNRNANIALINYKDGEKRYIIAPNGLKVDMIVENGESADIKVGNALPLKNIPVGTMVHCIELKPGACMATIGVVGHEDYKLVNLGKAGRKRHMGIRPTNRGSVMNPNDHPHGGGEGRAPIGRKSPMTPWGKPALGVKTRKSKKKSEKLIVSRKAKK